MKNYTDETDETGTRRFTGDGGGRLALRTDGTARALWVWTAAVASDFGAGKKNDDTRFTVPRKGLPPAESESLRAACDAKADATAFPHLPADAKHPEAREFLDIHRPLAWRLLRAVATGDANTLRTLAEAVEMMNDITATRSLCPSPWREIAEAIAAAAEAKQGVPTRAEVLTEYNRAAPVNRQMGDMRERLARMGFGWLPAPAGRPAKT